MAHHFHYLSYQIENYAGIYNKILNREICDINKSKKKKLLIYKKKCFG